jgi:hypothetical protein
MRTMSVAVLQTAILVVAAAGPVAAQSPASSFAELQGRLKPNQRVSVYAVSAMGTPNPKTGKVMALSDHTLELLVDGRREELTDRDIRVIAETYKEKRKHALIGLAVGAVIGGLTMAASCRAPRDPDSCGNATGAMLMWTGLGAAIGASSAREHERVLFLAP